GRLSASVPSHHSLSLADFITNTAESDFQYTQVQMWRRVSIESRPNAGAFHEASTSNRPTIKQINALVTSEAHGQPWLRDSSHRVCMSHLSSDASAETDQPTAIGGRSAKVLALV